MEKHSKLGASSCERWFNCPGSIALIKQAPEQPESIYAAEGSVAHIIAAKLLANESPYKYLNTIVKQEGFDIEVNLEMMDAIIEYVKYVCQIQYQYKLKPWHIKVEQQVSIPGHPDLYGTADCIINVPYNRLIVIDYKHGAGVPVPVVGNKQLLYYALGAWNLLTSEEQQGIDKIELVIVQPRTPGAAIDSYFVHPDALAEFHKELLQTVKVVELAKNKPGYLNAGDWCKFCPAKTICPAFKEMITEGAGDDFKGLLLPEPVVPNHPTKLGPNQLAKILNVSDAIEKWLKDVESYARQLAEQGIEIPGYKLVEKYGNRKWKDEYVAATFFQNEHGIPMENKPKILSPAQLEKEFKHGCLFHKKPILDEMMQFIEKPLNGKTLVKISDKRPSINGEITDFNEVVK